MTGADSRNSLGTGGECDRTESESMNIYAHGRNWEPE